MQSGGVDTDGTHVTHRFPVPGLLRGATVPFEKRSFLDHKIGAFVSALMPGRAITGGIARIGIDKKANGCRNRISLCLYRDQYFFVIKGSFRLNQTGAFVCGRTCYLVDGVIIDTMRGGDSKVEEGK